MKKIGDLVWRGYFIPCKCNQGVFVALNSQDYAPVPPHKSHGKFHPLCKCGSIIDVKAAKFEDTMAAMAFVCPHCDHYQENAYKVVKVEFDPIGHWTEVHYENDLPEHDILRCDDCGKEFKSFVACDFSGVITRHLYEVNNDEEREAAEVIRA